MGDNKETVGLVSGIWFSSLSLGVFTGPLLGGFIYEELGFKGTTGLYICLLILTFLSLVYFSVRQRVVNDKERTPINVPPKSHIPRSLKDSKEDEQ